MRWATLRTRRGLTLVETVVALGIFSVVALGLAQMLSAARKAHVLSQHLATAVELAGETMERVRAGDLAEDPSPLGAFCRSWSAEPALGYARLNRVSVSVTWNDPEPQRYTLSALMRMPP